MGPLCLLVPGVAFHRDHKGGWSVTVDSSRIPDGQNLTDLSIVEFQTLKILIAGGLQTKPAGDG